MSLRRTQHTQIRLRGKRTQRSDPATGYVSFTGGPFRFEFGFAAGQYFNNRSPVVGTALLTDLSRVNSGGFDVSVPPFTCTTLKGDVLTFALAGQFSVVMDVEMHIQIDPSLPFTHNPGGLFGAFAADDNCEYAVHLNTLDNNSFRPEGYAYSDSSDGPEGIDSAAIYAQGRHTIGLSVDAMNGIISVAIDGPELGEVVTGSYTDLDLSALQFASIGGMAYSLGDDLGNDWVGPTQIRSAHFYDLLSDEDLLAACVPSGFTPPVYYPKPDWPLAVDPTTESEFVGNDGFTIVWSDFNSPDIEQTHVSSDWWVFSYLDDVNPTIVWSSLNDTVNLTTVDIPAHLANNSIFNVSARYNGSLSRSDINNQSWSTNALNTPYP